MTIAIDTRDTIRSDIIDSIKNALPPEIDQIAVDFPDHPLNILATAFADGIFGMESQFSLAAANLLPSNATAQYLSAIALNYDIERTPGTRGNGAARVFGNTGGVISPSVQFVSATGVSFTLSGADRTFLTEDSGTITIALEGIDTGTDNNLDPQSLLSILNPPDGVEGTAIIGDTAAATAGFAGGTNEETDGFLRQRLLARIRAPLGAGTAQDYISWALSSEDHGVAITRAWLSTPTNGVFTIFCMKDDIETATAVPISTGPNSDATAISEYIESVRPLAAAPTVAAPLPIFWSLSVTVTERDANYELSDLTTSISDGLSELYLDYAEIAATVHKSALFTAGGNIAGVRGLDITARWSPNMINEKNPGTFLDNIETTTVGYYPHLQGIEIS